MGALIESMKADGKRPKVHDTQAVFKLPGAVKELVKRISEETGKTEAAIHRDALAEYLERRGYRI